MAAGCLVLVACGVAPVALAGADGSGTPGSKGDWISTTAAGNSTPNYVTQVDTTGHADAHPVTALNSHGQGVIAWVDEITGYVVASHIEPGDKWSAPEALDPGTQPAAAVDPAGDITVTWIDSHGNVDYGYRAAGAAGFVTGQIAGSPYGALSPQVVMDSGGNAWVVWSVGPAPFGFTRAIYGAYISASALARGGSPSWKADLSSSAGWTSAASLATNPSGSAVIAAFPSADNSRIGIAYAQSGSGSLPTPVYNVPNPGPGGMEAPAVALSDSGDAVLTWDQCRTVFGTVCAPSIGATIEVASATAAQLAHPAGAAFTDPQTVPFGSTGAQYRPHVAVNNSEVALAWDDQTHPTPSYAIDGATEPLADLNGGGHAWTRLDLGGSSGAVAGVGPRVAIDANSNVTLAWDSNGPGYGDSTINATTTTACGVTCATSSTVQLDSQASAPGRLSLAGAPDGDALLTWTSYAPSHGVIPTVVADAYDPGPVLSNVQIPTSVTAGTAETFSVQASDDWTALEGPIAIHWDFGDGTTATGDVVTHTYASAGTYTVTVTAATTAASTTVTSIGTTASTTISNQVVVSPAAVQPSVQPAVAVPLSGVAAWGTRTAARAVAADVTVPALSCGGNTTAATGQELGVRLWGTAVTPLADFAGVDVECEHHAAVYRPTFTLSELSSGTSTSRRAKLKVTPGDLVEVSISVQSDKTTLSMTDLSTPNQSPAAVTGPALTPEAGWQVGAFPIPSVHGPYPTVPTGFTNVTADGKGIGSLSKLQRSTWGSASVSEVGKASNSLSVLFSTVPPAPRGGNLAAPAAGSIRYQPPGSTTWKRLKHNTPLPPNTLIDATRGTVQLSNPEPHHQNQSVTAWGGEFTTTNNSHGATTIRITGTWHGGPQGSGASAARAGDKRSKKSKSSAKGSLWAKGHGNFTTKGNYGAAAVLGTKWLTRNLRTGTLFQVAKNRYDKNDAIRVTVYYPHRHTVTLRQGHSLLAPAPKPKVKPKAKPKVPAPKPKPAPKPNPFAFTIVGVNEVNGRYNTPAPGYYKLVITSQTKPYYVDAAVAPLQPSGGGSWFYADGSVNGVPRWEVHFQLKQSLATFQQWNIGIKLGSKLYVVPLRLK